MLIFFVLFLILIGALLILCAVVERLPVLRRQLPKLRLPHYLRGLFDARDWCVPDNMLGGSVLSLLHLIASRFGECLAMVKDFNVD
jgi:hypothetical protein